MYRDEATDNYSGKCYYGVNFGDGNTYLVCDDCGFRWINKAPAFYGITRIVEFRPCGGIVGDEDNWDVLVEESIYHNYTNGEILTQDEMINGEFTPIATNTYNIKRKDVPNFK